MSKMDESYLYISHPTCVMASQIWNEYLTCAPQASWCPF